MNRIDSAFQRIKERGEKALIAYLMAGDPTLEDTEAYVQQLAQAGADIIELGVPFSDPIADGPVIQQAAERALRSGTSLRKILATVRSLRKKTQIPLVLMAYYNSIFRYGEAAFCRDAVAVGFGIATPEDAREVARIADGVIVGSALVKVIAEGNHAAVTNRLTSFTRSLKSATLPA